MRKRNRWTRLLAMILAVAMVLSSQSVTAFATQFGAVVNNGTNETETPDETQTADETDSGTNSLPSPDQSAETTVNKPGVINGENVNLREGPGTDYEKVALLQSGDAVTVLTQVTITNAESQEELWYRVQYDGGEAYVYSNFLTVQETEEEPQVMAYSNGQPEETIQITSSHTNAAPGTYITLTSSVELSEGQARIWQYSADGGSTWRNVTRTDGSFENGATYRFALSNENAGYSYRLTIVEGENVVQTSNVLAPIDMLTPEELAEDYYGASATSPQTMASVSMTMTDGETPVLAGDTVSYNINYRTYNSPLYKYGDRAQSLIDEYKNSYITLTLPEGMTLEGNVVGVSAKRTSPDTADRESWKFTLDTSLETSVNRSFEITVKVNGNGSTPIGTEYGIVADDLKIHTEGTIIDKSDSSAPVEKQTYPKDYSATSVPATLVSGSNDIWGIEKTAGKSVEEQTILTELSEDGNTISVYFTLEVGLTANGSVISDEGNYARIGRVPFADGKISITDTPSLTGRNGSSIQPTRITITENWSGKNYIFAGEQIVNGSVTAEVSTDTCEGNTTGNSVAETAPFYSTYTVTVEYPNQGLDADFSDNPENETIPVTNNVTLTYRLAGEENDRTDTDNAQVPLGSVSDPATLIIEKYIQTYDSDEKVLYTNTNLSGRENAPSGSVTFTVTYTEAEGTPTLYQLNEDGDYEPLHDNTVTIDPSSGNGTAAVYLAPGNYTVTETEEPQYTQGSSPQSVTLTENEEETLEFVNREDLGKITVTKYITGTTTPIANVGFTLYSDPDCQKAIDTEKKTGTDGKVTFERLIPGTYYAKETTVPSGYIGDTSRPLEIKVKANETATETVYNRSNSVSVLLQKKYQDQNGTFQNVNSSNNTIFNGKFTIERYTPGKDGAEGSWNLVTTTGLSLNTEGKTNPVALPVYEDGTDTPITYRFAESLPEGWHGVDAANVSSDGKTYYSDDFTLKEIFENSEITDKTKTVTMQNVQHGTLTLEKKFVEISGTAQSERSANAEEATFSLYRKVGETVVLVKDNIETDGDGKVSVGDLPLKSDNTVIEYYWVETSENSDYVLEAASDNLLTTIIVDSEPVQAIGPFKFEVGNTGETDGFSLNLSTTAYNVEQKVPLQVLKTNAYTNNYVSGAKITIYRVEDNNEVVYNDQEDKVIPNNSTGYVTELEPGYKYIIRETGYPENYVQPETAPSVEVDLTGSAYQMITRNHTALLQSKEIKNTPYPKVKVDKYVLEQALGADGTIFYTSSDATGITFEIYTKSGESYEPVKDASGNTRTITPGSTISLPAGTYYLKEVLGTNSKVLDPSDYAAIYDAFYKDINNEKYAPKNYVIDNNTLYYGPYMVEQKSGTQDLDDIYNISSKGSVLVKKVDENGGALSGATLAIYEGSSETSKDSKTSAVGTGYVLFEDLSVYGTNGEKIEYTIRETSAPEGYYVTSEEITVTLEAGKILTKNANGEDLTLQNHRYTQFTVNKVYRNLWEYTFTNKQVLLEGAEIALYKKDGDQYKYVKTEVTDMNGQVVFKELEGMDYVAIEVSAPDVSWPMEPAKGDYLGEITDANRTLSESDLSRYNYVKMDQSGEGTLVNQQGWTQIQIYKWKWALDTEDPKYEEYLNKALEGADVSEYETERVPQDNSVFNLYQYRVPEEIGENATLRFEAVKSECTLIGTYTSGSMTDADGDPIHGYFMTDILETGDDIVYWLVETEAGPGGAIIPSENYVLFKRNGTGYSNSSNNDQSTTVVNYNDESVTLHAVEDEATYGNGSPHYAKVQISKWAGSYNGEVKNTESFEPLPNTKYELWVADKNGNLIRKVETLTTGLENNISDDKFSLENATAAALSTLLYYEGEDDEEKETQTKGFYKYLNGKDDDISWGETAGGTPVYAQSEDAVLYYVRMALVETYAPYGYAEDERIYYMNVRFGDDDEDGGTGTTINNAYYVKDRNGSESIPLAENQLELTFAEYRQNYRLVNWENNNYKVDVYTYGYTPNNDLLNMTSQDLNQEGIGRTPINVQLVLQRYDVRTDKWMNFDPDARAYTEEEVPISTESGGKILWLNPGQYRLKAVTVPETYENLYTGEAFADAEGAAAYRTFTVGNADTSVSMYYPTKQSMAVKKTDLEGTTLVDEITFTLNQVGGDAAVSGTTDSSGQADLTGISSGSYYLSESGSDTYSAQYLGAYIKENYPAYADLADSSKGYFFGYDSAASEHGDDVVITEIHNVGDLPLEIRDPEKGSLTVEKVDAQETTKKLSGAKFMLYYQPFTVFSGTYSIQAVSDGKADLSQTTLWKPVDTEKTTGQNGTITWDELDPGVYYLEETAEPDGYDKDSEGKFAVVNGGMEVTVKLGDTNIEAVSGPIQFTNTSKAVLKVKKTIAAGNVDTVDVSDHTFTFSLYAVSTGGTPLGTVTIKNGETKQVAANLTQGTTYYLEETFPEGSEHYALTSVKYNSVTVAPENSGRYPITLNSKEVTVEATNQLLYAKVTLQKVDKDHPNVTLERASFAAYTDENRTDDNKVAESVEGTNGEYTLTIPLADSSGGTFYIYEETAPQGYVGKEEPIAVTVKPGDSLSYATNASLKVENTSGAVIQITKYDNMHADTEAEPLNNVTFAIYQKSDNQWIEYRTGATKGNGVLTFTVPGNYEYALEETWSSNNYLGLEGIWKDGDTDSLEPDADGYYEIGTPVAGNTYSYKAYNIPKLTMEVRKAYKDGTTIAEATIGVYDVTDAESMPENGADWSSDLKKTIDALKEDASRSESVATSKPDGANYTSGTVSVQPGRTYLIVEEELTSGYTQMILDNSNVVWYQIVSIPEGAKSVEPVTLYNVTGNASLTLEKTSDSETLESLFNGQRSIRYTLDPSGGNTYGLESYTLTDKGLKAYHKTVDELGEVTETEITDTLGDGWYEITSVEIPKPSHDVFAYGMTEAAVTAEVTFRNFAGKEIGNPISVEFDGSSETVSAPAGEKAATVEISYTSSDLMKNAGYALGHNFDPGQVAVNVLVYDQVEGSDVVSIDKLENTAEARLTYYEWTSEGQKQADSTQIKSIAANDSAVNEITPLDGPVVTVEKATEDENVELDGEQTYTITIKNDSTEASKILQNPIIVDVLPTGSELIENSISSDKLEVGDIQLLYFGEEEKAVKIPLTGKLGPNESVTVTMKIKVAETVVSHGNTLWNYAFVTSGIRGKANSDNPVGASFKNSTGNWAEDLLDVAKERLKEKA